MAQLIEALMVQRCKEADVDYEVLTPEERSELRQEVEAELRGDIVLDGVLCNPDLMFRKRKGQQL